MRFGEAVLQAQGGTTSAFVQLKYHPGTRSHTYVKYQEPRIPRLRSVGHGGKAWLAGSDQTTTGLRLHYEGKYEPSHWTLFAEL